MTCSKNWLLFLNSALFIKIHIQQMRTFRLSLIAGCSLFACLFVAGAPTQQSTRQFVIDGHISPARHYPLKLYLFINGRLTDSVRVKNGTYRFHGRFDGTESAFIKANRFNGLDGANSIVFLISRGLLTIRSDQSLGQVSITGRASGAANDYRQAIRQILIATDSLNKIAAFQMSTRQIKPYN
jgi:hypothetical protein